MRRHSYSIHLEDKFIFSLPEHDEDFPKEEWIKLIEDGKLIEQNLDNIKYLIRLEAPKGVDPKINASDGLNDSKE